MKKFDMSNVPAQSEGEGRRLPSGGYVCRITGAEDRPDDEYLHIEFDIAEGDWKGFYAEGFERFHRWSGSFNRSYKEKALGFFKGFVTALEESNPGYKWDWNEKSLIGKQIGIVMGEEEYVKREDKTVHTSIKPQQIRSVDVIRNGKFTVPELKKLRDDQKPAQPAAPAQGYTPVDDEHLPF